MNKLKLSGRMIHIPMEQRKTVTVKTTQRNGFEVRVQFIDLSGTIVKSFICANNEVSSFISVYSRQYNYTIVK